MRVLMLAAENDALPHAKVGGVGDVLRDVPEALAEHGVDVDIILPDYADYQQLVKSERIGEIELSFSGQHHKLSLLKLYPYPMEHNHLNFYALSHETFAGEAGQWVYRHDDEGPFATDATKFALYCQAVLQTLSEGLINAPDVFHFHDWHSAFATILLEHDPSFSQFKYKKRVFSIHNLALQGIRPFSGLSSSLMSWYPQLTFDTAKLVDPRYPDCVNPMRAAINYCEKIHLVSPNYALEVQKPSKPEVGFFGGEGLEADLQHAATENKVVGILNGCNYEMPLPEPMALDEFLKASQQSLLQWMALKPEVQSVHLIAWHRVSQLVEKIQQPELKPKFIASFVGRLTSQKVTLLLTLFNGKTVLEHLLAKLEKVNGMVMLMGSGDAALECKITQLMAKHENLIFLNGYTASLSEDLYGLGDLFLMPSSFEPCGISQMLSMRRGQPCIVHHVGGLKDTVIDGVNGFAFSGDDIETQCENLIARFDDALNTYFEQPKLWQSFVDNALAARFSWQQSVKEYIEFLYS